MNHLKSNIEAFEGSVADMIEKYKVLNQLDPGDVGDSLDGDAVDTLVELLRGVINNHEGNK